jgi:SP family sugar porter-like MFS transporter
MGVPEVLTAFLLLQVFPANVRGLAGSLATLVNWTGGFAVTMFFNFLLVWSAAGTLLSSE